MELEEIPGYAVLGPLGAGGTAEVFLAERRALGGSRRRVALKRVLPALVNDPAFRELFLDEARVAMQLQHRNIVQVYDCVEWGASAALVMEYVDGCDLRALLADGPLPLELALTVAIEVLHGLDYAHRREGTDGIALEIVHRDVTPGNILLSREGEVKLADFGLARSRDKLARSSGGVKGTFAFMAPEQAEGTALDARADLFATGAVLYAALSGRSPFEAEGPVATLDRVREARFEPLGIADLDEILARALRRDPEARWPSAAAMRQALEALASRRGLDPRSAELARRVAARAAVRPLPVASASPAEPVEARGEPVAAGASAPSPEVHHTRVLGRPRPRRRTWPWVAGAAGLVASAWLLRGGSIPHPTIARPVDRAPAPASAPPQAIVAPPLAVDASIARAEAPPPPPGKPVAARPRPGFLTVSVDPWAYVFIDGKHRGTTPLTSLELGAGMHEVKLENPALGASRTRSVRIVPGERQTLSEKLSE